MKIGILTFWESTDNYGQVLQAWALQQVLKKMGHEPYLIRYSLTASTTVKPETKMFRKLLKIFALYPILRFVLRYIRTSNENQLRLLIENKNLMREFSNFRKQNIVVSPQIYKSIDEIRKNPPVADCYIAGSDQVWNMLLDVDGNRAYYLDFGPNEIKRISYAASFARPSYPTKLLPILKELLVKFDKISVREKEGVEICNKIGLNANCVADPTLLLQKQDYSSFYNSGNNKNGLFVYLINVYKSKDLYWEEIKRYANEVNMDVYITTSSGNIPGREIIEGLTYNYLTIPEWLKRIDDANLVVTTSFHGIVFSIIMKTNFVYIPLKRERSIGNGRVESLLTSLGLENKICYKESEFENCVSNMIDWIKISKKIDLMRLESIKFLRDSLS